jgi:hypothetical protein
VALSFWNFFSIAFLAALLLFGPGAEAQTKRCECTFKDNAYEAYGTNAACSAWSARDNTSCEISFGGTGADKDMVSQVLGVDIEAYNNEVLEVLIKYFTAIKDKNQALLLDQSFLQQAFTTFSGLTAIWLACGAIAKRLILKPAGNLICSRLLRI